VLLPYPKRSRLIQLSGRIHLNAVFVPVKLPSTADLKRLMVTGWWALKLVWSTNRPLSIGLLLVMVGRAGVPAGLAIFARGLINVFTSEGGLAGVHMDAVLPWLFSGSA
jgi:hypothetical protein